MAAIQVLQARPLQLKSSIDDSTGSPYGDIAWLPAVISNSPRSVLFVCVCVLGSLMQCPKNQVGVVEVRKELRILDNIHDMGIHSS